MNSCEVPQRSKERSNLEIDNSQVVQKRAEGSLFTIRGTTLHSYINNSQVFKQNPLYKELYKLGYPLKSINSMIQCGNPNGYVISRCGCGEKLFPITRHCDLRTCPTCSERRKKRIRKKYLPFLESQKIDNKYGLYFMTISPENYDDLDKGIEDMRKNFNRWKRSKYIAERLKAGLFVIEVKETWTGKAQYDKQGNFLYYHEKHGWNIHLHALIYSRRLDNRIRGRCNKCHQNLLNYNRDSKSHFCASKKCGSYDVLVKDNSKLNQLWKKSSGKFAHFDITSLNSISKALNYTLKYIATDKGEFQNEKSLALYMITIRSKRLISPFGLFFKNKPPKFSNIPCKCNKCNHQLEFFYNLERVSELLYLEEQKNRLPPNFEQKSYPELEIEIVKIK